MDFAISELSDTFSRSQIQKLIKESKVLLDGCVLTNCSQKVSAECAIEILESDLNAKYDIEPENIPLEVLFEDEHVVIINKPAGLVCHPAPGHKSGTLVNAIMYHFKSLSDINGDLRPGIVHRLDKDTSGVMLIAKTNEAHMKFADLFANEKGRLIKRKYECFVFGSPKEKSGEISNYITRNPKNRQAYTTSETSGKYAITQYKVAKTEYFTSTKSLSKIECELLTGRTHQIRVHMKYLGVPIVGDQVYGKSKIETCYPEYIRNFPRQALHSKELEFIHPITKEPMKFISPLPEDLQNLDSVFKIKTDSADSETINL